MFYLIYNLKKAGMLETGSNRISSPGTTWGRERRRSCGLGVMCYTLSPLTPRTVLQGCMTVCILGMRSLGREAMLSAPSRARTQALFCCCFCRIPQSSMDVSQPEGVVPTPSRHYAWSFPAHGLASKLLTT